MGSIRSIRLANGPQIQGRATHITYDRDEAGNRTARHFTDPDGQEWTSKIRNGVAATWRFA